MRVDEIHTDEAILSACSEVVPAFDSTVATLSLSRDRCNWRDEKATLPPNTPLMHAPGEALEVSRRTQLSTLFDALP